MKIVHSWLHRYLKLRQKLLKLPDDLGGMLKPFCYANMATGIFLASIVLIPLGILTSAISDLMSLLQND
jgi:hypothetical protein